MPTREPIEPCICKHDGGVHGPKGCEYLFCYCRADKYDSYGPKPGTPQPTAQAGEACKTCGWTQARYEAYCNDPTPRKLLIRCPDPFHTPQSAEGEATPKHSPLQLLEDEQIAIFTEAAEKSGEALKKVVDEYEARRALPSADSQASAEAPCEDCGSTDWPDWTLLPHEVYNSICPNGSGYLCLPCFAKRVTATQALSSAKGTQPAEISAAKPEPQQPKTDELLNFLESAMRHQGVDKPLSEPFFQDLAELTQLIRTERVSELEAIEAEAAKGGSRRKFILARLSELKGGSHEA